MAELKKIEDFERATPSERFEALRNWLKEEVVTYHIHLIELAGLAEEDDVFIIALKELPLIINDYDKGLHRNLIKHRIAHNIEGDDEDFMYGDYVLSQIKEYLSDFQNVEDPHRCFEINRELYMLSQVATFIGDPELKRKFESMVLKI